MAKGIKAYVINDGPESDREVSGIRTRQGFELERQTAKVARVDLERLLEEERRRLVAEDANDDDDRTIVAEAPESGIPESQIPESQETTVKLQAPDVPEGTPSPLGSDFPPPVPELTAVMKFTPVPIPSPSLPPFEALRSARNEAMRTKRIVVAIWACALTVAATLGYVVASQG